MDENYVDELVLLTNTPVKTESLLNSQKQAVRDIDFYGNSNKAEFICFKNDGTSYTLNGKLQKFVDQFTYLGGNILSTESDVNICIGKALSVIDRLAIIWKSGLSCKIKKGFSSNSRIRTILWLYSLDLEKN